MSLGDGVGVGAQLFIFDNLEAYKCCTNGSPTAFSNNAKLYITPFMQASKPATFVLPKDIFLVR